MKLSKDFVIPILIYLICGVIAIAVEKFPIFFLLIFGSIIIVILIVQNKTNNNWGWMFIFGILFTIIILGVFIGILLFAKHYEWLRHIILWPYPA